MRLAAAKSVEDTCRSTGAVLGECLLGVSVQSLAPQPPDAVVQMRLDGLRGGIGGRVPQGACVTGLTPFFFVGELLKKRQTGYPPAPPPPLVEGSRTAGRSAVAAFLFFSVCSVSAALYLFPSFSPFALSTASQL
ncbi:uncharacterized protein Tco025E_10120 [Trypanosoma conorhini]|uniref:Uncharacterized protein n=1 Tax=Trypanosoma conorhini TaxID=83891 RepID=A0A422MPR6_9TRYP|nr:uncharacterized protein Tco025E_10120 [Trypanosoma conorhini]RNE95211.1 hypothetical protein Tco025E_10120 [Trypanosoma conorhini]